MTDEEIGIQSTQILQDYITRSTDAQKRLISSMASDIISNPPAWFPARSYSTFDSIRMATSFRRRLYENLRRSLKNEEILVDNGQRFVLLPVSTASELMGFLSDSNVLRIPPLDTQEQLKL